MFMRLVQVYAKFDSLSFLPTLYSTNIVPQLRRTPGCLFGGLIQSTERPEECISMTLWDTPEHAESYEQSGVFQKLLQEAEAHLSDSLEWRIQLSKDLRLDYAPMKDEPVVRSYRLGAVSNGLPIPRNSERLYIRILSIKLMPGKLEEFAQLYNEEIIPTLKSVAGCRYAFLTEGIEERNEVLSVTIWDRKEDAEAYEARGIFESLQKKVRHTFSELYQWKLAAEKSSPHHVATSEDMRRQGYEVVAAQNFR